MNNLVDLARKLASGKTSSRELVETCLEHIEAPGGEGERVFLSLYTQRAITEAAVVDEARKRGWSVPRYAGIPISIKDLFDTEGEVTRAASRVLEHNPPARRDAPVVQLLRKAGFIILGKTNMTEFAYSGLGMNAHFGTPKNPFDRASGRIPGGSTAGGAVSVADNMAYATIGTDTGGSCRIPAALCGIVGFKPTSARVSRDGVIPLSQSLDSIGPLANSVSCCAVLDSLLSGGPGDDVESFPESGLRLAVLDSYVNESLDETVAQAYEEALVRLSRRGVKLTPIRIPELSELPVINRKGGLVGAEAYAWHQNLLETRGDYYDAWIRARFEAGKSQTAADYIELLQKRQWMQSLVEARTHMFDAMVLPSVQIMAPTIAQMKDPELSAATNLLLLRNTAIGNFLDRPAISVPCHQSGTAPVGLMLMGRRNEDRQLLSIARGLEYTIRPEL